MNKALENRINREKDRPKEIKKDPVFILCQGTIEKKDGEFIIDWIKIEVPEDIVEASEYLKNSKGDILKLEFKVDIVKKLIEDLQKERKYTSDREVFKLYQFLGISREKYDYLFLDPAFTNIVSKCKLINQYAAVYAGHYWRYAGLQEFYTRIREYEPRELTSWRINGNTLVFVLEHKK